MLAVGLQVIAMSLAAVALGCGARTDPATRATEPQAATGDAREAAEPSPPGDPEAVLRARLEVECPPMGEDIVALRAALVRAKVTCVAGAGRALVGAKAWVFERSASAGATSGDDAAAELARVRAECGAVVAAVEGAEPTGASGCFYDAVVTDPTAQIPAHAVGVALEAVALEAVGRDRDGAVDRAARLLAHTLHVGALMTRVEEPLGWAIYGRFADWGPWLERWAPRLDEATAAYVRREVRLARAALLSREAMFTRALAFYAREGHTAAPDPKRPERGPALAEGALALVATSAHHQARARAHPRPRTSCTAFTSSTPRPRSATGSGAPGPRRRAGSPRWLTSRPRSGSRPDVVSLAPA